MPPVATETKKRRGRVPVMTPQRKQLVWFFINEFRRVRGYSPTYEEIAKGIGYKHVSEGTAFTLVDSLVTEGWITNTKKISRSIMPVYPPEKVYAEITDPDLKKIAKKQKNLVILRRL